MAIEQLQPYLNKVSTQLIEGATWHRRAANECRKFPNCRGFGRWHEAEAICDFKTLLCFEKITRDNLKYNSVVDVNYIVNAYTYTISDFEALKNHFSQWIKRENIFIEILNASVQESRAVNMELYALLCSMMEETQNEAMRVDWVYTGMEDTGWGAHDCKVTSKWLHEYFEKNYKGGKIDFNIG